MNSNENDKDNRYTFKKPPIWVVDQEAERLIKKYSNPEGKKLYCKALNTLPISRIMELETQAESGNQPGRLFTVLISQELQRKHTDTFGNSLDSFRKNYGR